MEIKAEMKLAALFFIILICLYCSNPADNVSPSESSLYNYLNNSAYTDPGEYAYLYDGLPDSYKELCVLIKRQLIHPLEAREEGRTLPGGQTSEDQIFPTVKAMLEGLLQRDPEGLNVNRKPEDKLVVACYHHAMLLASILRYKNIPVRIRAGFSRLFEKEFGVRFGHTICEVWDKKKSLWILVDPDRQMVDFSRRKFDFAPQAWEHLQKRTFDIQKYTSSAGRGDSAVLHILFQDFSCVIGEEKPYWIEPPILDPMITDSNSLSKEKLDLIDRIAGLLIQSEVDVNELDQIRKENDYLQVKLPD